MSYTAAQAAAMSDGDLDAAYDAVFKADNDQTSLAILGTEIASRLASVGAFLWGAVGGDSFPLYEADLGVMQQNTSAQTAIQTSASNVASSLTGWGAGVMIVAAILGIVYLVAVFKK